MFIHHPASPHDLGHIDTDMERDRYMREIQNFHMDTRGWADFAYTHAVFQDGTVVRGRGIEFVPAAQLGHNTNTFAVLCVLGDREIPSPEMRVVLWQLKNHYDKRAGRDLTVKPHSAVTATSCPGDKLRAIIANLNTH